MLGKWTEIYSGDWEDYSENLYKSRVESNLSNRESELHYLGTNSGFIYMKESNYEHCFNNYMRECILIPTAKIRAILFIMLSINESLDILSDIQQEESKKRKERTLQSKVKKLEVIRNLRQNIQEQMGFILNELAYNRRYHQTYVIKHLMKQFQIEKTYERITTKFEVIYDSIQNEFLEHQLKQERNLQYLNILIIASVLAQVLQFIITATSGVGFFLIVLNIFGILLLIAFLIYVLIHVRSAKSSEKIEEKPRNPKSNYAVAGLYLYDKNIFQVISYIMNKIGYSKRGELEITDVNNFYIRRGKTKAIIIDGFWSDAGTFNTLLKSSNFIKSI